MSVSCLTEECTKKGLVWSCVCSLGGGSEKAELYVKAPARRLTLSSSISSPQGELTVFWAAMSNERTPLITSGVCGLTMTSAVCGAETNATPDSSRGAPNKGPRQLNTFFGVMVPTVLSMFSIILFLRTGEWTPNGQPPQTTGVLLRPKLMRCLSSRVCGWSRRTAARSVDAGRGLHHCVSYNTLHLCHFHQWRYTRGRSLLYPDSCCPEKEISL